MNETAGPEAHQFSMLERLVRVFLRSNLSIVLILLATLMGIAALLIRQKRKIRKSWFPWWMFT